MPAARVPRKKPPRPTAEFRERLAAMRWKLVRDLALTDTELASLDAQQRAEFGEVALTSGTGELLARIEERERHELEEIIAAQRRLAAGVFGACEGCHRSIPLARLRAMPTARRCAACQRRAEAPAP